MAAFRAVIRFPTAAHARADRLACRVALVLELTLLAWLGGRIIAGHAGADVARLVLAVVVTGVSLLVSVGVHGAAVLGLEGRRRS